MNTYSPHTLSSYSMDLDSSNAYKYHPAPPPNGYDTGTMGRMVVDGNYIDGSWELGVYVEDVGISVKVRVRGDQTLGELMHRTAEATGLQQRWSGHGVWWPFRNRWLLHTKTTLDQYGIQSDAKLEFRPIHGDLLVVLPSQTVVAFHVSYAARVFSVVRNICKELNIRHSEEFSLSLELTKEHMKANKPLKHTHQANKRNFNPLDPRIEQAEAKIKPFRTYSDTTGGSSSPYATLQSNAGTLMRLQSMNSLDDQERLDYTHYADCRLRCSAKSVFGDQWLMQPKNLMQKARLNSGWLDSSRSLLEQNIRPPPPSSSSSVNSSEQQQQDNNKPPTLRLGLKFYAIYDLNPKYDAVRIHQIYEQARWSILSGQFDCTEDEMVVFAAYQVQAEMISSQLLDANSATLRGGGGGPVFSHTTDGQSRVFNPMIGTLPRPSPDSTLAGHYFSTMSRTPGPTYSSIGQLPGSVISGVAGGDMSPATVHHQNYPTTPNDELDELLSELEQSCGVADEPHSTTRQLNKTSAGMPNPPRSYDTRDTDEIPVLQHNVRVFRDRKLFMKRYKMMWAVIKELRLQLYENRGDIPRQQPVGVYYLRGCSASPEVSTANEKYIIKLQVEQQQQQPTHNSTNGNGHDSSLSSGGGTREELLLRFDTPDQFAHWMAAFRLGSEGKTLASRVAFNKEVEAILDHLRLQVPGPTPMLSLAEANKRLGDLSDFCAEKIIRKAKSKDSLRQRISEAHGNIRDLSLLEAKQRYILAWQRLNNFGRSYFAVKFDADAVRAGLSVSTGGLFSTPTNDLIAVSQNRIEVVNPHNGDILKAWSLTELKSWNVNWDADKVLLVFRSLNIQFRPLSANCKTIAEFIGGYVFLGQRNPEKNSTCNERQFHRLTCTTDIQQCSS